jgi:condensin-2 complex subunit H2
MSNSETGIKNLQACHCFDSFHTRLRKEVSILKYCSTSQRAFGFTRHVRIARACHSMKELAELLQAVVSNLVDEWQIDLADQLDHYLEELARLNFSFEVSPGKVTKTNINFIEASNIIQSSATIYSKKVEALHELVFQALARVSGKQIDRNQSVVSSSSVVLDSSYWGDENSPLLPLDDVPEGRNIDLPEESRRTVDEELLRCGMAPLSLRDALSLSFQDATPAVHDEIRLHVADCSLDESGMLMLDPRAMEINDHGTADNRSGIGDGHHSFGADEDRGWGRDDENYGDLEDHDVMQPSITPSRGAVGPESLSHRDPGHHAAEPAVFGTVGVLRTVEKAENWWKPLDPHAATSTGNTPFRKVRTALDRECVVKPTPAPVPVAGSDFRKWYYDRLADYVKHIACTRPPLMRSLIKIFDKVRRIERKKQKDRVPLAVSITQADVAESAETYAPAAYEDQGWGGDEFDEALDFGGDDDVDDVEMRTVPIGMLSSQNDNVTAYHDAIDADTAMAKRIKEWEDKILPILEEQLAHSSFDMHAYEEDMLRQVSESSGQQVDFSVTVEDKPLFEVCRSFLTALQLASEGHVELLPEGDELHVKLIIN